MKNKTCVHTWANNTCYISKSVFQEKPFHGKANNSTNPHNKRQRLYNFNYVKLIECNNFLNCRATYIIKFWERKPINQLDSNGSFNKT